VVALLAVEHDFCRSDAVRHCEARKMKYDIGETMVERDIRETIIEQIKVIAMEQGKILAPISDKLDLADVGLDSLGFAVLVVRLEDELRHDPFTTSEAIVIPKTFGEFVRAYEDAAKEIPSHKSKTYHDVIDDICDLNWSQLNEQDIVQVAWAYHAFSVQFRECLEVALRLAPNDAQLIKLDAGERNTDNLSPWPEVAAPGEKMHHDEFMRRALKLSKISTEERRMITEAGYKYLVKSRAMLPEIKVMALTTYEDGGLEKVFRAILTAPSWNGELQRAFKHFLVKHIEFDSDPTEGHGALCRHLTPDDRVALLWVAFRDLLVEAVPRLRQ
jgi:acyl carrier protein